MRAEGEVDGPGVFVFEKHALPGVAAVGRAKHAALSVWAVRVTKRGYEDPIGVLGINQNAADLAAIFETYMSPGVASVR